MLMTSECIYGYENVGCLCVCVCVCVNWELLDWEFVMIIWCWMDDLSSMGLCYKWDCVVECGMCWKKNVWKYICDDI